MNCLPRLGLSRVHSTSDVLVTAAFGLLVFFAALTSRVGQIDLPPIYDEFFHLLAGQSWAEEGTFRILDGSYVRSALYTMLVGTVFDLSGTTDVAVARFWTAAVPGALLVAIFTLWSRATTDATTAVIVAAMLIFWPTGIEVSQFARFYSVQGFLFICGAITAYVAFTSQRPLLGRSLLLAAALALFALAAHFQIITAVGVAGVGIWVLFYTIVPWFHRADRRGRLAVVAAAIVALALFFGPLAPLLEEAWAIYQSAPPRWDKDIFYYHRTLRDSYPTLWPLYPIACLIALARKPKLAGFSVAIFLTTVIVQSFGIRNDMRYLYQSMPFFFLIWALALRAVAPVLFAGVQGLAVEAMKFMPSRLKGSVATVAVAVALIFAVFANAAYQRSVWLVSGVSDGTLLGQGRQSWPDAAAMLEPWRKASATILTTHPMTGAAELGNFDLVYNETQYWEANVFNGRSEGSGLARPVDPRHGRPVIGTLSELRMLISCRPAGVLVTHKGPASDRYAKDVLTASRGLPAEIVMEEGRNVLLVGWRSKAVSGNFCGELD
jgi:hypothetical protein